MKEIISLLVLSFLLSGCIDDAIKVGVAVYGVEQDEKNPEEHLHFIKNEETKLCFVTTNGKTLNNIPCSKEVLAKIEKNKKVKQ
jgi:hypothetical protein